MKHTLDCSSVSKKNVTGDSASSYLSSSPFLLPLEDQLVRQLATYQAFDSQHAFSNLDFN